MARNLGRIAVALVLGQMLAVLISLTGVSSQSLAERGVRIPTTQSLGNYVLLAVVYAPVHLGMVVRREGVRGALRWVAERVPMYGALALLDVEANFLVVMAYQYTTITSVMLLDCFSIPAVMALSYLFLRARYRWSHYLGVAVALAGIAVLVFSDWLRGVHAEADGGPGWAAVLLGDALCLAGTSLYAASNVAQEAVVKARDPLEYLAFLGVLGSIVCGLQAAVLEGTACLSLPLDVPTAAFMALFAVSMFLLYSLVPLMLVLSSATLLNLSLLTSDIYAILWAVTLFSATLSVWYFVACLLVVTGIAFFSLSSGK